MTRKLPKREIIALYENGKSMREIGLKYRCSYGTVSRMLHLWGIKINPYRRRRWSKWVDEGSNVTALRRQVIEWYGFKCIKCGKIFPKETASKKLHLHHIWQYPVKLVTLCQECHANIHNRNGIWE